MKSDKQHCRGFLRRAVVHVAVLLLVGGASLFAQLSSDISDDNPATSRHQITIGGKLLSYTARAGFLTLRDDAREPKGRIFYVSYTLDRSADKTPRPLTFAWNGGPGSPAGTLHLAALGPRRTKTPDEYKDGPPPPYQLIDNEQTWLAFTDLVFVDPIGTGYSYPTSPENLKEFWNVRGDVDSIGEFIRLYLTHYEAGDAPLFIAGESYGTPRAASLSKILADRRIPLSGVILMSSGNLARQSGPDDMGPAWLLPSYTASAFFHKKLPGDLQNDMQATLRQAENWAETEYATALIKGDRLTPEEREKANAQLARFTGLDPAFVAKYNLRIPSDEFAKQLLRDKDQEVGHYGAHLTHKLTAGSYDLWNDPSLVTNGSSALIVPYLRTELGFKSDARYAGPWGGGWPSPTAPRADWTSSRFDFGPARAQGNPAADLADAMRRNPNLRVLMIHGYFDLVTPYFAAEYAVSHMGLDSTLRRNFLVAKYPGGHSMYTEKPNLTQLTHDVADFIRGTTPARHPTPSVQ